MKKDISFDDMMAVKPIEDEDEMLAYQRKKRKGGTTGGNTAEYEETEIDEFLTPSMRSKMAMAMKRAAGKIALGKKKAANKIASSEVLMKRAMVAARKAFEKKILKDKSKDDISYGSRGALEKQLDKKGAAIKKLAKKLFKDIKKKEKAKFASSNAEE